MGTNSGPDEARVFRGAKEAEAEGHARVYRGATESGEPAEGTRRAADEPEVEGHARGLIRAAEGDESEVEGHGRGLVRAAEGEEPEVEGHASMRKLSRNAAEGAEGDDGALVR